MHLLATFYFVAAAYLAFCGWDNLRLCFQDPPAADTRRKQWPWVTVCIPARNEETRIGRCIESFLAQDYPKYDLLVLDDQSTDHTWDILKRAARHNRRLHPIKGKPLPKGWMGKAWACQQMGLKAKGAWILFADADTWHEPDSLRRTVQAAEARDADLLSCMPGQEARTWMEYLVIPAICYDLVSFFPKRWVLRKGSPLSQFVWANGQFLFFKMKSYRAVGGHIPVMDRIDEDLTFGKIFIRRGFHVRLFNGSPTVTCRMYTSARDVWEGFSKIMFQSFNFSVVRALSAYGLAFLFTVLPFFLPFFTKPGSPLFNASLVLSFAQVYVRLHQAVRFRFPILSSFLHPFGNALILAIGLNSMRWHLFLKRSYWKGRVLAQKDYLPAPGPPA